MNEYNLVGEKIARCLAAKQRRDGAIYDEVDKSVTPPDHYTYTFFALAAVRLYKKKIGKEWLDRAVKSLDYFFGIPKFRRGHEEFNNLAILLLYEDLKNEKIKPRLDSFIKKMDFRSSIGSNYSNNWLAMRGVCHELKHRLFGDDNDRTQGRTIINHILELQLNDGFFIDYPSRIEEYSWVTPFVYHAKICALLLLYYQLTKDEKVIEAVKKGLDTLLNFIAPDGETFYYGRTNNSLFGYACAIYAYESAAGIIFQEDMERAREYSSAAKKMLSFIKKWQDEDGCISIVPNREAGKVGWDYYMHHTVYNAYASALLLLIENSGMETKEDAKKKLFYAPDAGLLSYRAGDFFVAFSVRGQSVEGQGYFSMDLRYTGMNPLALKCGGSDIITPPPIMLEPIGNTVEPEFLGFSPYVKFGGRKYMARTYDHILVKENSDGLEIESEGNLISYSPITKILRPLYKLFQFLVRKKVLIFRTRTLEAARIYRKIAVFPKEALILFVDRLKNGKDKKLEKWFFSARLNQRSVLEGNRISGSKDGFNVVYENLYPNKIREVQIHRVNTSKGYAYVFNALIDDDLSINALYLDSKLKFKISENTVEISGNGQHEVSFAGGG